MAGAALDLLEVDAEGLDRLDREILRTICEKFGGGPVGLSTLAVAVGEEQDTVEDVYEPYLLQRGFIERTPRGRAATRRAFSHLGLQPPGTAVAALDDAPANTLTGSQPMKRIRTRSDPPASANCPHYPGFGP